MLHSVRMFIALLVLLALGACQSVPYTNVNANAPDTDQELVDDQALVSKGAKLNRFLKKRAIGSIVLLKKGGLVTFDSDGKRVRPCLVCSPKLAKKYGPKCRKYLDSRQPICNKLIGTNIQSVKAFSIVRHTGSNCETLFPPGDPPMGFPICWD